jgi:hypothetical protein
MSDDYFTRLDRQLAQLTVTGTHLERSPRWPPACWSTLERAVRRTAVVVSLAIVLAAVLVVEFPGSATGSVHRRGAPVALAGAGDRGAAAIASGRSGGGRA